MADENTTHYGWVKPENGASSDSWGLKWNQNATDMDSDLYAVETASKDASNLNTGTIPNGRFPATLPAASGVNLTALNASNLGSGTVPDARFPATLPAASGANLTGLNASNLSTGTIPDGRFPGTLPAASGANLTALNGSNISSGTVAAARGGAGTVSGIMKANGSGSVSAATSGTDYAPATSGSSILYGNGSGGFSAVSIGAGLQFSGGTLTNTVAAAAVTSVAGRTGAVTLSASDISGLGGAATKTIYISGSGPSGGSTGDLWVVV